MALGSVKGFRAHSCRHVRCTMKRGDRRNRVGALAVGEVCRNLSVLEQPGSQKGVVACSSPVELPGDVTGLVDYYSCMMPDCSVWT